MTSLDRVGVREAMQARRFFSTRLRGLRIDATADGVRMGQDLAVPSPRTVQVRLDVDRGPSWWGRRLVLQVLRPGSLMPRVAATFDVVVPRDDQPVISVAVPVDLADGPWMLLRLVDPADPTDSRATGEYSGLGGAVAYTAPWFLSADAVPTPVVPEVPRAVALPVAAIAGMGAAYALGHRDAGSVGHGHAGLAGPGHSGHGHSGHGHSGGADRSPAAPSAGHPGGGAGVAQD